MLLAIDFGTHSLKMIRLQKKSGGYTLTHFGAQRLPLKDGKSPSTPGVYTELLRQCMGEMSVKKGCAAASLSARSTLIRHVEFPQIPLEDMKKALKLNSSPYLHQHYTDFNFDCHILAPRSGKGAEPQKSGAKMEVMVGGASVHDVLLFRDALTEANLVPLTINLAPVAVINAFEASNPAIVQRDTVALVDIGCENSVISVMDKGAAVLTRSIPFGGFQITNHVAKTLSLDEQTAEEEKLKMSETVQVFVGSSLSLFARQIRSSIDFFERQHEVPVKRVFCSGGTALSGVILQFLTDEVGLPCVAWNPMENIPIDLKTQTEAELTKQAPNFAVAVGTALAAI